MAKLAKFLQGVAGNAGGAGLDVNDVFSTYLYVGAGAASNTGAAKTITNGIDLSNEGGLVWIKHRNDSTSHSLVDSEVGVDYWRRSDTTGADISFSANSLLPMVFNEDGFTTSDYGEQGYGGGDFASWTWRKAPKFFDIVEFEITRDGSNNLTSTSSNVTITNGEVTVDHNLGVAPAIWFQKCLTTTAAWYVRSTISGTVGGYGQLHRTNAWAGVGNWTFPSTDTQVGFGNYGFFPSGTHTYVAYLFAHNDGDGEFGPDSDQDIIKCGSYTTDGSGQAVVDLGFEPQFLLTKKTNSTGDWTILDNMRGFPTFQLDNNKLYPNTSGAEVSGSSFGGSTYESGFRWYNDLSSQTYIYMAIRRGPLSPPESATEVFAMQRDNAPDNNEPAFRSGFPVDFALERLVHTTRNNLIVSRLTAPLYLKTDSSADEAVDNEFHFDYNNGWNSGEAQSANMMSWMWGRAPGFCDVVCYTGDGVIGRAVGHNLGVAPEMMWIKERGSSRNWNVYHAGVDATAPEDYALKLDTDGSRLSSTLFNNTAPTSSNFTVRSSVVNNGSGRYYIAYLFASLDGISKLGSYTGNGSSQTIDCGFTAGARFVLIKRTNAVGSWNLWDSVRGIVTGNDPYIELNSNNAQVTTTDYIDPDASGFIVNNNIRTNQSGNTYIFYAIA